MPPASILAGCTKNIRSGHKLRHVSAHSQQPNASADAKTLGLFEQRDSVPTFGRDAADQPHRVRELGERRNGAVETFRARRCPHRQQEEGCFLEPELGAHAHARSVLAELGMARLSVDRRGQQSKALGRCLQGGARAAAEARRRTPIETLIVASPPSC
jgi:hypothetical protein